jgi:hypothetical protein
MNSTRGIITPHLDALANTGVILKNYCECATHTGRRSLHGGWGPYPWVGGGTVILNGPSARPETLVFARSAHSLLHSHSQSLTHPHSLVGFFSLSTHCDFTSLPPPSQQTRIAPYSADVQPICSPTRSALMTGRYTIRLGTQTNVIYWDTPWGVPLNETFIPQNLKAVGYKTAMFGK